MGIEKPKRSKFDAIGNEKPVVPEQILKMSVSEIGLMERTSKQLVAAGILTIEEVLEHAEFYYRNGYLRDFGNLSTDDLVGALERLGVTLPE